MLNFKPNVFVPNGYQLLYPMWGTWLEERDSYIGMLESHVEMLQKISDLKDDIIGSLKTQVSEKENQINRQTSFIEEIETMNSVFIKVLSDLKNVNDPKEFYDILTSYNIDQNFIPYVM